MQIVTPAGVWGQAISTGTVQGIVTDPANAAVSGGTVTLTEATTSTTRTAMTNDSGRYIFANVPVGIYDVTITKTGLRVTKFTKQEVTVGATIALDTKLELGSSVETIEVTATGANLETSNATVGNTISGLALKSLPTLGLDVSTFATTEWLRPLGPVSMGKKLEITALPKKVLQFVQRVDIFAPI